MKKAAGIPSTLSSIQMFSVALYASHPSASIFSPPPLSSFWLLLFFFFRPALSPADAQRYEASAKLYTKLMWRRERVFKRDLSRKLALKWAALHALPTEDLRREALVIDPFVPAHIRHALQTPPLAGFHGAEDAEREAARVAQEAAAALARAASAAERAASESAASGATGRRALAEVKRAAPARGGRSRGGTRSDDIDFGALLAPAAEAPANGGNKK